MQHPLRKIMNLSVALLLCLLVSACNVTDIHDSGLLLGLAKDEEALKKLGPMERMPDEFRTLWIMKNGNKLSYVEKKGCLLTPCGNDFWKIENHKFTMSKANEASEKTGDIFGDYEYNYRFTHVVAHLAGEPAPDLYTEAMIRKTYLDVEEGQMGGRFITIVEWPAYIGNQYASIISYWYDTGGGSYSSLNYQIKLYDLRDLSSLQRRTKSKKLIDLLAKETVSSLKKTASQYNKTIHEETNYQETQQGDLQQLTLKRQNGRWQAQIPVFREYMHQGNGSHGEYLTDYAGVDIKLPSSITSHDTLCVDWVKIKQTIPDAKDAVSSPDGGLLAVLTPKQLLVFENPQAGIGPPSLSIPVSYRESIIVNQWATGKYVSQWHERLKVYLK